MGMVDSYTDLNVMVRVAIAFLRTMHQRVVSLLRHCCGRSIRLLLSVLADISAAHAPSSSTSQAGTNQPRRAPLGKRTTKKKTSRCKIKTNMARPALLTRTLALNADS